MDSADLCLRFVLVHFQACPVLLVGVWPTLSLVPFTWGGDPPELEGLPWGGMCRASQTGQHNTL